MSKSRSRIPGKPSPRKRGLVCRLRADDSGATAIEFGIIALPFFALLIALIEVSLVFFANFSLDNAVDEASRLVRTGQAQTQGFSETEFKQNICDNATGLKNCMSGLKLDVQRFNNFAGVTMPDPLDAGGALRNDFTFDLGTGGDVIVVRAFYVWDLIASFPGSLGNMPGGGRLIIATAAFRNEPF